MAPQNIAEFFCCLDEKTPKKSTPKKRRKNAEKILKGIPLDKASCINTFFYEGRGYDEKSRKNFAFFLRYFFSILFFYKVLGTKKISLDFTRIFSAFSAQKF